ncbi:MAG: HAD family phosphatase [Deltaproteobacteria bacterium]|nr:HAD family phosphatase [Deltaproteobacteria bacterium]
MSERVEAVLFDFGGVFTESPFEAARALGRQLGIDPSLMMDTVFGPYDDDTDHPWHRLERGEIALMDAREAILALGESRGFEADLFRVLAALGRSAGPRREMIARARALRGAGLRTAIVTNNALELRDAWRPLLPLDELFDAVVDSCEVGFRKPDPRIFQHALAVLGDIAPQRALFLDDYEGNLRAARALGIATVLVEADPAPALAVLDELLASR